jgi:hypothetical protein
VQAPDCVDTSGDLLETGAHQRPEPLFAPGIEIVGVEAVTGSQHRHLVGHPHADVLVEERFG